MNMMTIAQTVATIGLSHLSCTLAIHLVQSLTVSSLHQMTSWALQPF